MIRPVALLLCTTWFWVAVVLPANSRAALTLSVTPKQSMVDQSVDVVVRARPHSIVTTKFTMQRFGMTFGSEARFRVPASGVLRLSRQSPRSGSYHGVKAMGLFWSAMPLAGPPAKEPEMRRDSELAPRPFTITASNDAASFVADGVRVVQAASVSRQVVDGDGMVATLFRPNGPGCYPGVIVLGGSEGGVPEEVAAVLASHQLATLALAYFGTPGLPKSLTEIPIETVERGLAFMRKQSTVCSRGIAIYGASKGAELALLAASTFGGVRAVVAAKPASVVFQGLFGDSEHDVSSWSYQGKPVPFANGLVPSDVQRAISAAFKSHLKPAFADDYLARLQNNTVAGAVIPVERIPAPVLLVAGGSDHLWPSAVMAQQIVQRRASMSPRFADRVLIYPSAGHHIGVPFEFAKAELAHSFLDLGGSPEADEAADEASWPIIVRFLQTG